MVISETGMLWLVVVCPESFLVFRDLGEKKGDLPYDKTPLISLRNDQSSLAVTFFEALDTSCCVNQFLLAGVKRMACRTDLSADLTLRGTRLECVTAQALNGNFGIFWVDTFFHLFLLQ